MKEIVFDARCMGSGIGTHTLNVIAGMRAIIGDIRIRVITGPEYAYLLKSHCDELTLSRAAVYTLREQIEIAWKTRASRLVHSLHYNAPLLHRGHLLVSIHDLTHLLDSTYRKMLKTRFYARPMLSAISKRADHIFTLSSYSKKKIVELLKVEESKITVTHCGVGPEFHPMNSRDCQELVRNGLGLDRPFILFIGNLKPHKNVTTLLQAFAAVKGERASDCDLVVVGDDPKWKSTLVKATVSLSIEDSVHFISYVKSGMLPQLYAAAQALVLPSFEEGFGLPILEAMAVGTPVICSNAASLPEVAGDAAEYFDPNNPAELAISILRVLGSARLQSEMRNRGFERAKLFSWSDCVRKHYEIYRSFLLN